MQEILDIYNESKLDILLLDYNKLSKVYDNAMLAKKGLADPEYLNIKRAVELYITKLISTKKINSQILNNYKKVFNKSINEDITYIFSNKVLNLPKEKLQPIMDSDTYNRFMKRKEKITTKCETIYNKFINKETLTKDERILLANFLRDNIGTKDPKIFAMQEAFLRDILNNEGNYGYEEGDFVVKFISREEAKENDIVFLSNLSSYRLDGKKLDKNNLGQAMDKRIVVNQEYFLRVLNNKRKMIPNIISTICHEAKHILQYDEIDKGIANRDTINCLYDKILRGYLSKEDYNYYRKNYYFESGELSAQISGALGSMSYLRKYTNTSEKDLEDIYAKKVIQNYKQLVDMREDEKGNKVNADIFKKEQMDKIIKTNPNLLKRYSQLTYFYNSDASPKTFVEMLIESADFKKVNQKDSDSLYDSAFNAAIDTGQLNQLDFNNMTREDLYKLTHALSSVYNKYSLVTHNFLTASKTRENAAFLNDLKDSEKVLSTKTEVMIERCKKLETVLDVMYQKIGTDYKKVDKYQSDQYLYERDKKYVRDQFRKINALPKSEEELNEMINDFIDSTKEKTSNTIKP